MITWSNVTAFAPELTSFDAGAQTDILAWVNTAFDEGLFSASQVKLAQIYLAAHTATLAARGSAGSGAVGPVQSETIEAMSRSYGGASSFAGLAGGSWGLTPYGLLLAELLEGTRACLPVVP